MILVIILTGVLIACGVVESALHRRALSSVPIRILVNGTRGKTSATRMLCAALNASGVRTWAKCTGTEAVLIDPDGTEIPVVRKSGASVREMIPFFRRAAKDSAQAAVVECMAIRPDLQFALKDRLVVPTITVILNAYVDHIDAMGATVSETARALSCTIAKGGKTVAPEIFHPYDRNIILPIDDVSDAETAGFSFPVYKETIGAVLRVLSLLSIDRETAVRGMRNARADAGMAGPFYRGNAVFLNGFAANDFVSAEALARQADCALPMIIVYNNRKDRRYRLKTFLPLIKQLDARRIAMYVIGEEQKSACAYFARRQISARPANVDMEFIDALCDLSCSVLCLGNIKGAGRELIEHLRLQEEKPCCKPQLG